MTNPTTNRKYYTIETVRISSGQWSATVTYEGYGGGNDFGATEQKAIRNAVNSFLEIATDFGYFDE